MRTSELATWALSSIPNLTTYGARLRRRCHRLEQGRERVRIGPGSARQHAHVQPQEHPARARPAAATPRGVLRWGIPSNTPRARDEVRTMCAIAFRATLLHRALVRVSRRKQRLPHRGMDQPARSTALDWST